MAMATPTGRRRGKTDMFALQAILLVAGHIACAFCAGMETGVVSCSRIRLLHLSRNGNRNAKLLLRYKRNTDSLLGTLLVGSNIASVTVSTVSASLAYSLWGAAGLGISSAVSTMTLLVIGEFLPKAWFGARPISRSLPFARAMRVVEAVLMPLSRVATRVSSLFIPSRDISGGTAKIVTREHLRILARSSEAAGEITHLENLMMSRALALRERSAQDIMVPAAKVVSLSPDSTLADVSRLVSQTGHGKFPVIDAPGGKCLGVLHIQDVLARLTGNPGDNIMEFVRKPFYIRATMPADDILPKLRSHGQRMAIVRDKAIPMRGIVTIDAILAIIAGNLPRDASARNAGGGRE